MLINICVADMQEEEGLKRRVWNETDHNKRDVIYIYIGGAWVVVELPVVRGR